MKDQLEKAKAALKEIENVANKGPMHRALIAVVAAIEAAQTPVENPPTP